MSYRKILKIIINAFSQWPLIVFTTIQHDKWRLNIHNFSPFLHIIKNQDVYHNLNIKVLRRSRKSGSTAVAKEVRKPCQRERCIVGKCNEKCSLPFYSQEGNPAEKGPGGETPAFLNTQRKAQHYLVKSWKNPVFSPDPGYNVCLHKRQTMICCPPDKTPLGW